MSQPRRRSGRLANATCGSGSFVRTRSRIVIAIKTRSGDCAWTTRVAPERHVDEAQSFEPKADLQCRRGEPRLRPGSQHGSLQLKRRPRLWPKLTALGLASRPRKLIAFAAPSNKHAESLQTLHRATRGRDRERVQFRYIVCSSAAFFRWCPRYSWRRAFFGASRHGG